jgi:hypothetical protein
MHDNKMKTIALWAACAIAVGIFPARLAAQLVRPDNATQAPAAAPPATTPAAAAAQTPSGKRRVSQEVQITGDQLWTDTGITVQPGEHVVATVTGKVRYSDAKDDSGPDGMARGFKDLIRILPFNTAGRGAVIGRVGDAASAQPFLIGAHCNVVSFAGGPLSLGINQMSSDTADGTYTVHLEIYAPDSGFLAVKQVDSLPGIDASLFSKIPRRIGDKEGNPGDMVNFLIIGPEASMQKVFTTAGWVKVDADVKDTVLHGFLESMSKESYLTMPMSPLYLFGRQQDYGWAHRATICASGKPRFRSTAKPFGSAPPPTISASKKTSATTA